jgi:hypothetical protein
MKPFGVRRLALGGTFRCLHREAGFRTQPRVEAAEPWVNAPIAVRPEGPIE